MTTHTTCQTFNSDTVMSIAGVAGRLTHQTTMPGKPADCWFKQRWISVTRPVRYGGDACQMRVEIRYDDECGNRKNSFAITATITNPARRGGDKTEACGCLHTEIARFFPELAPLIDWHLVDARGPMHYIANTVYHAQNGKFDYARSTAVWADMPESLMSDKEALTAALTERLPALLVNFRAAVEGAGFMWEPTAEVAR